MSVSGTEEYDATRASVVAGAQDDAWMRARCLGRRYMIDEIFSKTVEKGKHLEWNEVFKNFNLRNGTTQEIECM